MLAINSECALDVFNMTALLYMVMSYPLSLVARRTEAHLAGHPDT